MTATPDIDYDKAALIHQNNRLRDELNRAVLVLEGWNIGKEKIRMQPWSSKEDMKKAEAILFETLRSVLLPKKP